MRIGSAMASQLASPARARSRDELLRQLSELAGSQFGVVERGQLLGLGFTPAQIQRLLQQGHLVPLHRGVYAVGHRTVARSGILLAAVLAAGGISAISRRTAATHMGLWNFPLGDVDVILAGTGSRRLRGINIHRSRSFAPGHLIDHEGVPTTSAAWTLVDLAGTIGSSALRQCFDVAERKELIDHDELAFLIRNGSGRRGLAAVSALARRDRTQSRRTRSMLELDFLAFCREEGLPEPLVNHRVGGFEVDAIWTDASLVVELDSWEWHGDRESFERDRAKASDLQTVGLDVIAVTDRRLKRGRVKLSATIHTLLEQGDATSLRITKSSRITWRG